MAAPKRELDVIDLVPELAAKWARVRAELHKALQEWRDEPRRRCGKCQRVVEQKLQVCGRCKSVSYCSQACQAAHWAEHKVSGCTDDENLLRARRFHRKIDLVAGKNSVLREVMLGAMGRAIDNHSTAAQPCQPLIIYDDYLERTKDVDQQLELVLRDVVAGKLAVYYGNKDLAHWQQMQKLNLVGKNRIWILYQAATRFFTVEWNSD